MVKSTTGANRLFVPNGDRSWPSRSVNSLINCLNKNRWIADCTHVDEQNKALFSFTSLRECFVYVCLFHMVRVIDVLYCTDDGCIQRNAEQETLDRTRSENHERDAPLRLFERKNRSRSIVLLAREDRLPSTSEVRSVTVAALRRPAGRFTPIFSSFSRRILPPFFDFARRRMPPSSDALRHSGGDRRR